MSRASRIAIIAALVMLLAPPIGAVQQDTTPSPALGDSRQQTIVVLAVDALNTPWVSLTSEALNSVITEAPTPPAIYFEAIDAARFQDPRYTEDLRDWLRRKYRDTPVDLVVTLGEDALGFLASAHGEPWPTARVLYMEVGGVSVDTRRDLPQASGLVLQDHFPDAVRTIKTVLPDTKHVALIFGASPLEAKRFAGFADKVRNTNLGLEPIVVAGTALEELLEETARLPENSAVIILAPAVDANGRMLAPTKSCELFASQTDSPAFTLGIHDVGCGVVGGLLRDWTLVGRQLGHQALALLNGTPTSVVTVPIADYTSLVFDGRQLQRLGVPESRLPAGSDVRFREASIWRDHRALVLSALGVTLVQSLLIMGLTLEHKRRRRAEVESRRNLVAISHLDRRAAMGELATSLAHELNQPLNAILQNAGVAQMMLTSNAVPPALHEMTDIISDIRKDNLRASEVIRRMRGLLQKHELEIQPIDLNDVVEETVAIVRADAKSRDIQLDVVTSGGQFVMGDRVHLQQVLLNLLLNAVDAVVKGPSERRRVVVRTTLMDGTVRVSVVDNGVGIAAGRPTDVFEPFYTTKANGMGMGLAIARSIVEAHNGRMGAENNPDSGATVWFSVPGLQR